MLSARRTLDALGEKFDRIDSSLIRSSEGKARSLLVTPLTSFVVEHPWATAEISQSTLEHDYASRSGADGEWFRRVIAKQQELLTVTREADDAMRRMREKTVWMLERQRERGINDEVELIDPSRARQELGGVIHLVNASTEGVGEVYLGPPTRL